MRGVAAVLQMGSIATATNGVYTLLLMAVQLTIGLVFIPGVLRIWATRGVMMVARSGPLLLSVLPPMPRPPSGLLRRYAHTLCMCVCVYVCWKCLRCRSSHPLFLSPARPLSLSSGIAHIQNILVVGSQGDGKTQYNCQVRILTSHHILLFH